MGQTHSAVSPISAYENSRGQCQHTIVTSKYDTDAKDINYLVNIKHPPVKRPKIEEVMPPCTVCKQRKIIEDLPKQKVKMTLITGGIKNKWDEMGNESRSKMPWKATCY